MKKFPLILCVLLLSACFRMNVPAHFADTSDIPTSRFLADALPISSNYAGIEVSDALEQAWANGDSTGADPYLGTQFVMVVFPFTRLHFAETPESELTETAITALKFRGNTVVTGQRAALTQFAKRMAPLPSYELALRELSINVYDALFFRILSISGILDITRTGKEGAEKQVHIPLERTDYRRTGFAQEISELFSETLTGSLSDAFANVQSRSPHLERMMNTNEIQATADSPLLIVMPPAISNENVNAPRYFPSEHFSMGQVSRIVQRGLHGAFRGKPLLAVSLSSAHLPTPQSLAASISVLSTNIKHISVRDGDGMFAKPILGIELDIRFTEFQPRGHMSDRVATCSAEMDLVNNADNPGPRTLQVLSSNIARAFLNRESVPTSIRLLQCK